MDTEESREQLWHRLDNESGRAYGAFKVYMYLPPAERSVVGRGASGAEILARSASRPSSLDGRTTSPGSHPTGDLQQRGYWRGFASTACSDARITITSSTSKTSTARDRSTKRK